MGKKKTPAQRAASSNEKKRVLTDAEIAKIEGWSMIRHPLDDMAKLLGMSLTALEEIINKDDRARNAISEGRSKGRDRVINTLFNMGTLEREVEEVTEEVFGTGRFDENGQEIKHKRIKRVKKKILPDPGSLKFWLQTREGFKITEAIELTGKDGAPIQTQEVEATKDEILKELSELTEMLKERSKE